MFKSGDCGILLVSVSGKSRGGQVLSLRRKGFGMASGKEYLDFILEQLSGLEQVTHRAMMGEYLLYYRGKLVGGIYDDRLLVKPVPSAVALMPAAPRARPYEGAKELLVVEQVDDSAFLAELFEAMYEELPVPRKKK